jgi:hypothetical protein
MRKIFLAIPIIALFSLVGVGCAPVKAPGPTNGAVPPLPVPAVNEPSPPAKPLAVFGEAVPLTVGESAEYGDGLVVTLSEINDSRCPKNVQCIWQGELAPVLKLSGGALTGETKLTLGTVSGLTGTAGPYSITLSDVTLTSVMLVTTKPTADAGTSHDDKIRVAGPLPDQEVASPLTVTGEARGNWYFEASFPVKLFDADGKELAAVPAQAQGEWMTEDFVPFKAELTFTALATATGTLVLKKDNPSGLPQYDDEISIPVKFSGPAGPQRTIDLYFYDSSKDRDETGNVLCSRQGLAPVQRNIPLTKTPIQDAVRLLLRGDLTAEERAAGISTEFPLPGVELKGASLKDGVLTLAFVDPDNRTGGGSCRVGILWSQIEATAKQFPEVSSVRFMPEELFQP